MRTLVVRPMVATVVSVLATACAGYDSSNNSPGSASGAEGVAGATQASGATAGLTGTGAAATSSAATSATGTGGATNGGTPPGGATTSGTTTGGAAPAGATNGGATTGGGATPGGASSGGATTSGGAATSGGATSGGATPGGASSGGATTSGGATSGGASSGGAPGGGADTSGAGTGGDMPTGGSAPAPEEGPCDIYAAANTPCVAAYSMVRGLSSDYSGPLYQVRSGSSNQNTGSGGETHDIGMTADGFGDAAAQDAACNGTTCTISIVYDQSGQGNDLTVAPAGCYEDGSADLPDYESDATGRSLTVSGHAVYALRTETREGYRNNNPTNFPRDESPQGIYMVADGSDAGDACCWDFGNASQDNCYGRTGIMTALFLGTGYWGRGAGNGPWFMGDFEAGVWAGGSGDSNASNNNLPSSNMDFAFGILKNTPDNYAIRVGSAQSGGLTTAYDGNTPKRLLLNGAIILGIGGDNSNHSWGTFYEGVVTAGRPSDDTDEAVLANVQSVGYGQ